MVLMIRLPGAEYQGDDPDGFRDPEPEVPLGQDPGHLGRAYGGGERAESPLSDGVGIRSDDDHARLDEPLVGQELMADKNDISH